MFYSFLGPIGYGVANSLNKITGNKIGVTKSVILQTSFISLFLVTFNFFFGNETVNFYWFFITFLLGILGYFPLLFFIRAVSTGKIGVVIPIVDMSIIFPIALAYIFLGQSISLLGIFFVCLILFGVLLLSFNFKDIKNSHIFDLKSGVVFALLASSLWGTGYFLWNYPIPHIGAIHTSIFIELGVLFTAIVHLKFFEVKKFFTDVDKNIFAVGGVIGLFASLGTLGVNLSIEKIGVPVTMAIMGGRPAVGVLVGTLLYKEKLDLKQMVSLVFVILGVVGVSLYK